MKTEKSLEQKLKRERVVVCLNCQRFVRCDNIGKYEECVDFKEIKGEAWIIEKI